MKLGTTMFSFTREFLTDDWTLTDCFRAARSLGDGQRVEILDAQHIRSYPQLTADVEREFLTAAEATGVRLSLFGHEVDLGWIAGRPFDDDKIVEVVVRAMEMAARLGFPMFRANMPSPELLHRLLPHADRLDLQLLVELHGQRIDAPETQALIAAFDAWESPRVGVLQDLGAFTATVPRAFLEYKSRTGVPDDLLVVIAEGYRDGRPKADVLRELQARGADALAVETANECFAMFVRTAPQALAALGGHVRHVHTKFYEMVDGEEPCIPYAEIFAQLKAMDFNGILSSEWTGFNFIEEPVALQQLRAHQAMVRRLWAETAAPTLPTT
jgi:sugar phosphate isomerase/epimerase